MEAGRSQDKLAVVESPFCLALVSRLALRPATAAELARDLDAPAEKVQHHLRWLHDKDLVILEENSHGKAAEVVYTVDPRRHLIRPDEVGDLASGRFGLASVRLLRLIFREAMDAACAGTFGAGLEQGLERILLPLDQDGWEEVVEINARVIDAILKVRERSQVRLGTGGPAALARMAILFFESDPNRLPDRVELRGDSLSLAVVDRLVLKPATSSELANELGVPVERVRHQLKRLREAGLVAVHDTRRRRGAIEYVYAADRRALLVPKTYSSRHRRKHISQIVRAIFQEAVRATQEGRFQGRDDCVIVRVPLRLDGQGCQETGEVIEAAMRDLFGAGEKSLARLEKNSEGPRVGTAALLFFGCPREMDSTAGTNSTLEGVIDTVREIDLGSHGPGRGGNGNAPVERIGRDEPRSGSTPAGEND